MLLKILKPADRQTVVEYINRLPDDKRFTVEVKLKRERRSLDQNRLYWLWLSCLMDETGNSKDTLHEYFKQQLLGSVSTPFRMLDQEYRVAIPRSTGSLNTAEMHHYLERIRQLALNDLGIVLPDPNDRGWDEFYHKYKDFI